MTSVAKTKLDPSKSKFAPKVEKEDFAVRAGEAFDRAQARKQQAYEISQQFLQFFKSKTLPENKGPIEQSLERDIIKKVSEFAVEINNDPDEQLDGMGSTGVDILLLKAVISLRDSLNEAHYEIDQLKKQLKQTNDGK